MIRGMADGVRTYPESGPGGYLGTSFNRRVSELAGAAKSARSRAAIP